MRQAAGRLNLFKEWTPSLVLTLLLHHGFAKGRLMLKSYDLDIERERYVAVKEQFAKISA